MNYQMTQQVSIKATRWKESWTVFIAPEWGTSYKAWTIILQSRDRMHISILRNTSFERKEQYLEAIQDLLERDYTIINATLTEALIQNLGVKKYIKELLWER